MADRGAGEVVSGWVFEFDYRADNGPRLVGPFDTREDGELWLLALDIGDFEGNFAPMVKP